MGVITTDIAIVGAGHNGLVGAILLARQVCFAVARSDLDFRAHPAAESFPDLGPAEARLADAPSEAERPGFR